MSVYECVCVCGRGGGGVRTGENVKVICCQHCSLHSPPKPHFRSGLASWLHLGGGEWGMCVCVCVWGGGGSELART